MSDDLIPENIEPPITIGEMIRSVRRELKYRYRVYPNLVQRAKMHEGHARREIRVMEMVLETLQELEKTR